MSYQAAALESIKLHVIQLTELHKVPQKQELMRK